jgi:hypothetical protein
MVDQPKKVSGYKVEWLGETYYCSKRSEVGEWLQGLLEAHEGHEDVDLSEEPRISRVTMWRIDWEDWSEDYRSKDEAAEALRDLQIQADMARNPEAFEEVHDLHWDIFHPVRALECGYASTRPRSSICNRERIVDPSSIRRPPAVVLEGPDEPNGARLLVWPAAEN